MKYYDEADGDQNTRSMKGREGFKGRRRRRRKGT
jgi:hypothetical protein